MELFTALAISLLYSVFSAWYTYAVVGTKRAGLPRIAFYLPVVIANCCIPALYSTEGLFLYLRSCFAYTHAWLASLKGIGFCLNRGPLAGEAGNETQWSCLQFSALYYLSVYPAKEQLKGQARIKETARLLFHVTFKAGALLTTYAMMTPDTNNLTYTSAIILGLATYLFLGLLMNLSSLIAVAGFGITTVDNFDYPFFATSLRDFWRFRWNITTGKILRSLSYDIILDNSLTRKPKQAYTKVSETRRVSGVLAAFALSGLTHAVYFWIVFGSMSYMWFCYFIVQAFLLLLERVIQVSFSSTLGMRSLTPFISIPLIFHINLFVAQVFFLSEFTKTDGVEAALQLKDVVLSGILGN